MLLDDPDYRADLKSDMSNVAIGRKWGIAESSVRRHKDIASRPPKPTVETLPGSVELGPDGGTFEGVQTTAPLTDWSGVFERFNLDPNVFEIVGDTVRMRSWDQSKRLDNGDRDTVRLYSYSARFTRKLETLADPVALTDSLRAWTPAVKRGKAQGLPEAFIVGLADFQLGKSERGRGTAHTVEQIQKGMHGAVDMVDRIRAQGRNLRTLVLANLGDHTEGVAGSYASQTYSIDLNLRDQIQLALEINLAWMKALAPSFERVVYAATLCNHGQLSRGQGRDNVTDDADNVTGLIGDTLATVTPLHADLRHIEYVVPRDEMITRVTAEGVNIAMAHGQKITGREDQWLAAQSNALTRQGFIPDVWLTAHKHHAAVTDYGPYTRIQATTVDPGSKWFEDRTGMYSRPGVTMFTVSEHTPGHWADYHIA